ncbi:MAG: hypothetical protein AB9880_05175 [Christensenellales bacterium]
MKHFRRLIALAILLCLLSVPFAAPAQAQSAGLPALLERVPASAFQAGWLSYVNIPALLQGTPGAVIPENAADFQRLTGTAEGDAILRAYMDRSAGPADFFQHLLRAEEMQSSGGLDPFTVKEAMELGIPPARQMWLRGPFHREAVLGKLAGKGYQASVEAFPGRDVWGQGGKIDGGMKLNLLQRDPVFPFGGNLGQSWPVILDHDLLLSSPDEAAIRAAAGGAEPALSSVALVHDMVSAAAMISPGETGILAQLFLLTPAAAGLQGEAPSGSQPAERMPAFTLFSLSQAFTASKQWVLIGLAFPDLDTATAAERLLQERYAQARLIRTGELLSERVLAMGGQAEAPAVIRAGEGTHAVMLPFSFPKDPVDTPHPFRFFTNLLLSRDLGWLME